MAWFPLGQSPAALGALSQRSVLNVSYINDVAHYSFINHVLEGDGFVTPRGSTYIGVNPSWMELIDQTTGYPNNATASGKDFGGGLKFPDSTKFAGPYVITWDGAGTFQITQGTWTETNNTGTTYTKVSNGKWTNVAGQTAYIVANLSGWAGAPQLVGAYFTATGGTGGFARNLRIYRQADEADLLAGKVYRTAYKQQLLDHDPSAIRLMNWSAGNNDHGTRFEDRVLPTASCYGKTGGSFISSPIYGTTSGSMQYTLPFVSTGTRQTPASMTQGETVTCRIGSKFVGGPAYGSCPANITAISTPVGGTTRVTTATPHGFSVGMKAFHLINAGSGVPKMDRYPAAVTNVVSTTQYDITYSISGQTAYTGSGGTVQAYPSLNVGARGEYPLMFDSGNTLAAAYGDDGNGLYLHAESLRTFYFDKNMIGVSDGAGNYLKGAWLFDPDGGDINGHWDGIPLEILTKLFVELNQMSPAQAISMWVCYPHRGLLSIDPDYSSASNWAIQATNIILNGNTVGGIPYPGLKTGAPNAKLIIEYNNEIWNLGPHQGYWHNWYSQSRWGVQFKPDAYALRATCMARDIKLAYPLEAQIVLVMGLSATGMTHGDFFGNYASWNGSSTPGDTGNYYTTDTAVVSGSWGAPKTWFNACAFAPYFEPGPTYYDGTGTGSFNDDSAMYAGTAPYGSPNQAQAITNFINAGISSVDSTVALNDHLVMQDQYIANMGTGQYVIQYEGGPNWDPTIGAHVNDPPGYTHLVTAANSTLMNAAYRSAQLGTAMTNYMNSMCAKSKSAMPAIYLSVNAGQRWSFATPDSYAVGSSVEGSNLTSNPAWTALNTRNSTVT